MEKKKKGQWSTTKDDYQWLRIIFNDRKLCLMVV